MAAATKLTNVRGSNSGLVSFSDESSAPTNANCSTNFDIDNYIPFNTASLSIHRETFQSDQAGWTNKQSINRFSYPMAYHHLPVPHNALAHLYCQMMFRYFTQIRAMYSRNLSDLYKYSRQADYLSSELTKSMPHPMVGSEHDQIPFNHLTHTENRKACQPDEPLDLSARTGNTRETVGHNHQKSTTSKVDEGKHPSQQMSSIGSMHKCPYCERSFPRLANLNRHMRTHTGEQPYPCPQCNRAFSISSNLQRHVRSIHLNQRPFVCHQCGRRFAQYTNLERHYRNHTDEEQKKLNDSMPHWNNDSIDSINDN